MRNWRGDGTPCKLATVTLDAAAWLFRRRLHWGAAP